MKDEKKHNKELFIVEAVIGIVSSIMLIAMVLIAGILAGININISIWMIVISVVFFVVVCLALTKMEQVVGYYVCGECKHKHVPDYDTVLWSMHLGRTRYMRCPKCHKKSWQKKVLN